jgi:hypothetical protein
MPVYNGEFPYIIKQPHAVCVGKQPFYSDKFDNGLLECVMRQTGALFGVANDVYVGEEFARPPVVCVLQVRPDDTDHVVRVLYEKCNNVERFSITYAVGVRREPNVTMYVVHERMRFKKKIYPSYVYDARWRSLFAQEEDPKRYMKRMMDLGQCDLAFDPTDNPDSNNRKALLACFLTDLQLMDELPIQSRFFNPTMWESDEIPFNGLHPSLFPREDIGEVSIIKFKRELPAISSLSPPPPPPPPQQLPPMIQPDYYEEFMPMDDMMIGVSREPVMDDLLCLRFINHVIAYHSVVINHSLWDALVSTLRTSGLNGDAHAMLKAIYDETHNEFVQTFIQSIKGRSSSIA